MEGLLFEASYKFIVNKNLSVRSRTFEVIRDLNADPAYHQYLLMCKVSPLAPHPQPQTP